MVIWTIWTLPLLTNIICQCSKGNTLALRNQKLAQICETKRKVFVPSKPFRPSLIFVSKAGDYPREAYQGRLLVFLTNIRLYWKGLPRAYLAFSYVMRNHLSQILSGKARTYNWSLVQLCSSLAHKYYVRVEVTDRDKHHSSLVRYGSNYNCKQFYSKCPRWW